MYRLYMFLKKRSTVDHLYVFVIPFSQTPGRFSDVCDSFTGYTLVVFVSAGDLVQYLSGFAVRLAACAKIARCLWHPFSLNGFDFTSFCLIVMVVFLTRSPCDANASRHRLARSPFGVVSTNIAASALFIFLNQLLRFASLFFCLTSLFQLRLLYKLNSFFHIPYHFVVSLSCLLIR